MIGMTNSEQDRGAWREVSRDKFTYSKGHDCVASLSDVGGLGSDLEI